MARRKRIGQEEWTARERAELWFMIAAHADQVPDAEEVLADLRRTITAEECQPDPVTPEWRLSA